MKKRGFTLAELLIALAILGVISTFTIPKVLQSQSDRKYSAIVKEAAGTVAHAYELYKRDNTPSAATRAEDLIPYLNYVKTFTLNGVIDNTEGWPDFPCANGSKTCLLLHNGAGIYMEGVPFGGIAATNYVWVGVDPDGKYNGSTTGPYKAVEVILTFNGRITTKGGMSGVPTEDPAWFNWN